MPVGGRVCDKVGLMARLACGVEGVGIGVGMGVMPGEGPGEGRVWVLPVEVRVWVLPLPVWP